MLWQVSNLKKYSVWICQDYLANLVRQKVFLPIALISKAFRFINVDFMVVKTQIFMGLGTELIEEDITSQVIQMRKRLNHLQV
jgi:hypothetical protein